MANFNNNLYVGYDQVNPGLLKYNMYTYSNTYSGSNGYIHFKTSVPLSTYVMTRVEAIGHNYGTSSIIRCAWNWYTYSYLAGYGVQNFYSGMTANNTYVSGDGYVCFSGYLANYGDVFFTLNASHTNPTGNGYDLSIQAVSLNSTSGAYY